MIDGLYSYYFTIYENDGNFYWKQLEGVDVVIDDTIYLNKTWLENHNLEGLGAVQCPILLLKD